MNDGSIVEQDSAGRLSHLMMACPSYKGCRIGEFGQMVTTRQRQNVTQRQAHLTDGSAAVSMHSTLPRGSMESDQTRDRHVKGRLRMLIATHLQTLPHERITPPVGTVVLEQGAPAERVLLIEAGEVCIHRQEAGGAAQLIATAGAGELLGEMTLIGDPHHSATVSVSRGPAELLAVQTDHLLQAALYDSDLVMELLALSSARCRRTSGQLALMLEALAAVLARDQPTLRRCCQKLSSTADPAMHRAAGLLDALGQDAETA